MANKNGQTSSNRTRPGVSSRSPIPTLRSYSDFATSKPLVPHVGSPFVTRELDHPYKQVGWVRAAIGEIAKAMRMARLRVRVDEAPEAPDVPDEHPIAQLMRKPSPGVSARNVLTGVAQWLALDGEALVVALTKENRPVKTYGEGAESRLELPTKLLWMRGGQERLHLVDKDGAPYAWRWSSQKGEKEIPYAATALVREDDPDRPFRGCGALCAAFGSAEAVYLAGLLNKRLLLRGGEGRGYITVPDVLGADERDRMLEEIDEHWDNAGEAGRTRLLHGGAKHLVSGATARDLMYPQLWALSKKDISAVLGVPDAMLGEGASNYATFAGERRRFWEQTVIPVLELLCDTINQELIQRLRDVRYSGLWVYADVRHVRALREDIELQTKAAMGLRNLGVPLRMALDKTGLEGIKTIPGEDVALVPTGLERLEDVVEGPADPPPMVPGQAPPPPSEDGEDAEEDDDDSGPDGEGGDGELASSEGRPLARAAVPTDSTEQELREWYIQNEARREHGDRRIVRAVRKVWRAMRKAQLQHLEALSRDERRSVEGGGRIYSDPAPDLSDGFVSAYRAAWAKDLGATRRLKAVRPDDPALVHEVRSCTGDVLFHVEREIATSRWESLEREFGEGVSEDARYRIQDLILLRFLDLSEGEIDSLLILQQIKWVEFLGEELGDALVEVLATSLRGLSRETGLTVPPVNPTKIQLLRDHGVSLAGQANSTLSRRVRSAMIRALAEDQDTIGSLRERIRESLVDLEGVTRDQFDKASRRALLIARTETSWVDNSARYEQHAEWYREGRMMSHEWVSREPASPPGRTRPSHVQLHGTRTVVGEPWISPVSGATLYHPGDQSSGVVKEFANCRCGLKPRRLRTDLAEGFLTQEEFDRLASGDA